MSNHGFEHILSPSSVAIVGASEREGSLGGIILKGMLRGGFAGPLFAVNPNRASVHGVACFPSLREVGQHVALAVIATPPVAIPAVIGDAIASGVRAAIIITAGLGRGEGSIASSVLAMARQAGLRIVGPNCLGVLAPHAGMNASFARGLPKPGGVALVSQSGAIAAGLLAWAAGKDLGFSGVVSLGDALDVDIGDCLDHFAEDPATSAIILYVEGLSDARKFMSAARKAARVKPVIILKAGRHQEGARAAATHTGALAGSDVVFEAAFARAGLLRVTDIDELYVTLEMLSGGAAPVGDRLAIVTNGGGLGVLAVDRLMDLRGQLATVSDSVLEELDAALPPTWSRANPIDIIGDAPAERYVATVRSVLRDEHVDAMLVMNCPTAVASAAEAARAVAAAIVQERTTAASSKPVAAMWMGADDEVGAIFRAAGIPHFPSEADAVLGLTQLFRLRARREALVAAPAPLPCRILPDRDRAAATIRQCLLDGREWLDPVEVKALLDAYGIPVADARLARGPSEAALVAARMLGDAAALAIKIHSRDIVHKSDVDGVKLGIATPVAAEAAAADILERAARLRPEARIAGVTLHPMIETRQARELIVGMTVDPTFGPVLLFGQGGTAVEVVDDKALGLLPVDLAQARSLIAGTRVSRLLAGYRNVPPADRGKLELLLVRVSRLVEDNPEIVGLDLNPVLCDAERLIALDARVHVAPPGPADRRVAATRRFAVRPYPPHLESTAEVEGVGPVIVRPIRPTDAEALADFLKTIDASDIHGRFAELALPVGMPTIARLTQIDYAREMTLVALQSADQQLLGLVRLRGDADGRCAELALVAPSGKISESVASTLVARAVACARAEGYRELIWHPRPDEFERMLGKTRGVTLGFAEKPPSEPQDEVAFHLPLSPS